MTTAIMILVLAGLCGIGRSTTLCDWSKQLELRLSAMEDRIDTVEENAKVQPTCVTRWSDISGTDDDALSHVQCEHNEVLTGCSSYLPGSAHGTRDGDYVHIGKDGKPACVARNGAGGSGVKAIARCCNWPKMSCAYKKGPRSGRADDDRSTVTCPNAPNTHLTGCSASTYWQSMDGATPDSSNNGQLADINNGKCSAFNGASGGGVWAEAVCCTSPNLTCKAKWSAKSGGGVNAKASVHCDSGWTMTSCNVHSFYKNTDGAYIDRENCIAVNGGNGQYVYAIAICCQ